MLIGSVNVEEITLSNDALAENRRNISATI
jgi:hypothetical protein